MTTPIPTNNGNFDLTGVFKVQDKYITDLTNSYPDVNGAPKIVGYVADLQNQMSGLAQRYQDANTSSDAVLDHQGEMIDIINAEQDRLNQKKALIDQADFQQNREVLLNNTYRLQYAEYTKIVIVIIVALLVFLLLRSLTTTFASVPSPLVALLHVANIVIALIIITYIYAKLYTRSSINFDEIVLPPPSSLTTNASGSSGGQQDSSGSLFGSLGICYQDSCCGAGTIWDPNYGVCVIPNIASATTASATTASATTAAANPTTSNPTTPNPTTSNPTTPKPTTPKPTPPNPTTPKPTTPKPTTPNPTTPKPTTPNPTTPKPTTPKSTEKFTTLNDAYSSPDLLGSSYTASRNMQVKSNFANNTAYNPYGTIKT